MSEAVNAPDNKGALPTLGDEGTVLGTPTAKTKAKTNVSRVAVLGLIVLGCVSAVGGLVLYQRHRLAVRAAAQAEAEPKKPVKTGGLGAFNQANKPVESMTIGRKKAELLKQEEDNRRKVAAVEEAASAAGMDTGSGAAARPLGQQGAVRGWKSRQAATGTSGGPGGATAVGSEGDTGAVVTPRDRKMSGDVLAFAGEQSGRAGGSSSAAGQDTGVPRVSPSGVPDVRQQAYQAALSERLAQMPSVSTPAAGAMSTSGLPTGPSTLPPAGTDGLSQRLKPALVDARAAGRLPDLDWLLARGQSIPCVLQTGIDTTLPGLVTCKVMSDVRSANGKNVLIERGSMGIGEQQSSLRQGQARTFALWDRIAMPTGVFVELDSPATDQMGMSGIPGFVNNHFWERFGGAIMVSLIKDYTEALVQRQVRSTNGGTTYVNSTQSGADIVTETLKNSINIPPTLVVNPGTVVYMTVARDLSFEKVYEVVR